MEWWGISPKTGGSGRKGEREREIKREGRGGGGERGESKRGEGGGKEGD